MSEIPPIDTPSMTGTTKVLNILRDGLIAHDTRLQNLRTDLTETQNKVEILEKTVITGDLTGRELSHSERIRNLETFTGDLRDAIKYWGRYVVGALLLNFIGFMVGILVALIRFLPILEQLAKKP